MSYDIVCLGAGILGVSIATELVSRGYKVAVVAKDLPEDVEAIGFASPKENTREQTWDRITYERFGKLAESHPDLCELLPFYDMWDEKEGGLDPWFKDTYKNFKQLKDPKHLKAKQGVSYQSYCINAPRYLVMLADQLRKQKVPFIRKRLSSLHEAYDLPEIGPVKMVINATGVGAKALIGVEDANAIPIRGQTVLVKSPVKACYMRMQLNPSIGNTTASSNEPEKVETEGSYIIPRPGPESHVIIGGSFQVGNWDPQPDLALAQRILERAYDLCPELAPGGSSWRDIQVVAHNVGFRPARVGGCRLEMEQLQVTKDRSSLTSRASTSVSPRQVSVLHAYGIGPAGYQASLGLAQEAADMVDKQCKRQHRL